MFAARLHADSEVTMNEWGVYVMVVALASGEIRSQQPKPPPDPLHDVRFLVGRWSGSSEGQAGKGVVSRSYEPVLNERFLHERNKSEYAPQAANPKGEVHEHWSLLSYDEIRQTVVLRQFHVEGFVNTYRLTPRQGASKVLVFESEQIENLPGEWRARETYEQVSDDAFTETFELAPPGKPFETYGTTRLRRVR
jgi:hypothetical protein